MICMADLRASTISDQQRHFYLYYMPTTARNNWKERTSIFLICTFFDLFEDLHIVRWINFTICKKQHFEVRSRVIVKIIRKSNE